MRLIWVLILSGLTIGNLQGQSLKSVAKSLEKQEFDKAIEILGKSLEKEPTNAGAKYYQSVVFIDPAFTGYNVDSAYYFINQALADYSTADEKEIQKLIRDEITDTTLIDQKAAVEALGFDIALEENTVEAFNLFAEKFSSAEQFPEALSLRNKIAFGKAEKAHTIQSYMEFIRTYPEADQIPEAKKRHESLLFEDQTKDGKLASFIQFLEDHPQTPHRAQAEANIFRIQTAGNRIEDYQSYLKNYPNSEFQKQAVDMLYHLYKEQSSLGQFSQSGFSNDSIDQAIELEKEALIAVVEDGKIGFINIFGDLVIPAVRDRIPSNYQCALVRSDFMILESDQGPAIYARNGSKAYDQKFESVEDLGAGLLKIIQNGRIGVIHKSGHEILKALYSDIELLGGQFLKVKRDDLWGLRSVTDVEILGIEFDHIESLGEFITVEKNGRVAVTNAGQLRHAADLDPVDLEFIYDEVELIREHFLLGFSGEKEVLLAPDLEENFEINVQEILDLDQFWIVKRQEKFYLYNLEFELLSEEPYEDILYNSNWLALKKGDLWALQDQRSEFAPQFKYTLVKLLSQEISLVYSGKDSYALFGKQDSLATNDLTVQIIKPVDPKVEDHLLTIDGKGIKRLYGPSGRKILGDRFDELTVLTDYLFIIDENSRKGLSDSTGRNVLPINNDAIGDFYAGSASVLRGSKFGLFNYPSLKIIDPEYESQLRPYSESLYLATKDDLQGLINLNNEPVLEFDWDEIAYWTDTVAMVKSGDLWQFVNLNNGESDSTWFSIIEYVNNPDSAITIIYRGPEGVGVKSSLSGQIIEPGFDDIYLIQDSEPIYYAVKSIAQADYYVIVYFDMEGSHFWRQALTKQEFEKIRCER